MTDAEVLALKQKILDVETAIHNIHTGQSVRVFVDQNGERVEFNGANLTSLRRYLLELKSQLPESGVKAYTGPIGFFF